MLRKFLLRGGAASVVGAGGGLAYLYAQDEGSKRSMQFWKHVLPVYAHYRTVQLLNRDLGIISDEKAAPIYESLHELYADQIRDLCYKMRGFYLKNAQLMSTRDDFVPPRYMQWMKDTQDCLPPVFKGVEARQFVKDRLREDLNLDFDDVFESFDDIPVGVASIGQVHKAVLRKGRAEVAVKLQLPGMEDMFRSDVKTLKTFCQMALPQHVSAFSEIEKQFLTEFDYRGEAANLVKVHEIVTPKWGALVQIPLPIREYCGKHVLVMEFLNGVRLVDGIRNQYRNVAAHFGLTLEELEGERKRAIQNGTYKYKTLEEASEESRRMAWMAYGYDTFCTLNPWRRLYNITAPLLSYVATLGYTSLPPLDISAPAQSLDLGSLLSLLFTIHGHEIFEGGHFNGDPHPGNILLLDDGKLGLIDYGQVTSMGVEQRIIFAKLIIAIGRDDKNEIARIFFDEMGAKTKNRDKEVAYRLCCFWADRDTPDILQGMNIADFLDDCEAKDPMISVPSDYLVAQRVSVLLRGMGNAFGLKVRTTDTWGPQAKDYLKRHNIEY